MALAFSPKTIIRLSLAAVLVIGLAIGGTVWWLNKQRWEGTDNAFVRADTVSISPRIGGSVVRVLVKDNQMVKVGDILVQLDDADARTALAQAQANLSAVRAAVDNVDARSSQEEATVASRAAAVAQAQAQARLAQSQVDRYSRLAAQGWVSQQKIDTQEAEADTARAALTQARAALTAEQRTATTFISTRQQSVASVQQAEALVEAARLTLERTVIRAPASGVVGARGVRVGQVVAAGSQLMSIVPVQDTYVIANFKETQLGHMRLGQTVQITADAFPGKALTGTVESFAPATGSEFALIPVENATGNFTKITQRIPVRIRLNPSNGVALRPGLSVKIKVDLKSQGGALFAEAATMAAPAASAQ